jgi:hypothetical protein
MLIGLAPLLLALASAQQDDGQRVCSVDFGDGGRRGHVWLLVDRDYAPLTLNMSLREPDGWSETAITLDPAQRRFPGLLSYVTFAIRFTREPDLPLTMNAYADGRLRWRHEINIPAWPTTLDRSATVARMGRHAPGTAGSLGRADDNQPVLTPRELVIVLLDARGRQVGEARYALPGDGAEGPAATALAAVEASYRARTCHPPAPLID